MCALVSEVSNGAVISAEVTEWASRTPQWAECVQAELASPLNLKGKIGNRKLCASSGSIARFEKTLAQVGGPKERERWFSEWRPQIEVHSDCPCSERVAKLKLSPAQADAFGVGDELEMTTMTANSRVVRAAEAKGVRLEVELHRPVWLAGL
ncbi:hypothetical protein CYMTET_23514 [Cymbomonas tetramitiformis]|uniref:DUF1308 domain-containing protein n=1 Tax=Cymbomonas tetramitiformis TaxID=36881 RepID=A0AAE0L116_9CHLO|nr:hypothetical protein CYMTET_23514 [Cymbomonas tetramitiformis]